MKKSENLKSPQKLGFYAKIQKSKNFTPAIIPLIFLYLDPQIMNKKHSSVTIKSQLLEMREKRAFRIKNGVRAKRARRQFEQRAKRAARTSPSLLDIS